MPGHFYRKHVPRLTDHILKGDVSAFVIDETPNDNVRAFIDLPAGEMTTFQTFKETVQLGKKTMSPSIREVCFARFVILHPRSTSKAMAVTIGGKPYDVYDGDLVIVSNVSKVVSDDSNKNRETTPHFPEYKKLLTEGAELGSVKILSPGTHPCPATDGEQNVSEAIKKALKHHQERMLRDFGRTPSGDCGAVGNP